MKVFAGDIEKRVVELAQAGDRDAMKQIYDCYSRYLAAVCSRYVTAPSELRDVLQDAFVKIFDNLHRFEYRGEGSLRAWLRQVVVNEALKRLRDRKKSSTVEYRWEMPDMESESDDADVGEVPPGVIQDMIKELPDGYRAVFNLYVFEEKNHREIASLLGITESTSASQLHRARAILARKITEYRKRKEID